MKLYKPLLSVLLCLLLLTCSTPDCGCVNPTNIDGHWEWVKTVTPSQTLTPQQVGYTRTLDHNTRTSQNMVEYYRNDTLYLRLKPTAYKFDALTVLETYDKVQIKYVLTNLTTGSGDLQASEPVTPYTERADTLHHFYKLVHR